MADLEKLAVKRDRGYLVRLIVSLMIGLLASFYIYAGLTGDSMANCMSEAFLGKSDEGKAP